MHFSGFNKYLSKVLLYACIVVPILVLIDTTSVFSYFYAHTIIVLINILIKNDRWDRTLIYYHYYMLFGVLVYLLNKYQLPGFIGTTGPEGIGTDDYTFYGQIVEGNVPYELEVPAEYKYPFSLFLQAIYPFHIYTPLNIVLCNIVFVTYMPYFTGKLADYFFNDHRITKHAIIMILLCPMTTLYGVIIIRDLLVTTLVLASIYYFLKKKYMPIIITVALVFFVRFGSVSFIAASFMAVFLIQTSKTNWGKIRAIIIMSATIVLFVFLLPALQEYSDGKLSANVIRAVDGEYFDGSTIASIVTLPFPINIILSSLFFAIAPLLSIPALFKGVFVIINFFNATLTPIFFIFISPYLFNSFFGRKSANHKLLICLLIVFLVVLGTVSLQIRHKNIIFPFMCILAAYGSVHYNRKAYLPTTVLTSFTILIEVAYALYSYSF